MKSLEFSVENCNELISDSRRRILSSEARKFADAGIPLRPLSRFKRRGATYWGGVLQVHEQMFWHDIYRKRIDRIKRMKERNQ